MMRDAKVLLGAVVVLAAVSLNAEAKLYKWVDENGTTHYGETIPPQYAGSDRSELNKTGRVIKHTEVLTADERRARAAEETKARDDKEAELERKRRDKALLSTYTTVEEIDLARSRNLQQVEARINSLDSQLKMVQERKANLDKEAANYTANGRKQPKSLVEDLSETQVRIDELHNDLGKARAEQRSVDERYDADKSRFRELTGL